ncbi:MAG: hypothetical protein ACFFAO_18805 [Candidatus Hermodarchaeota archaeon]
MASEKLENNRTPNLLLSAFPKKIEKKSKELNQTMKVFTCDICGSTDIVETHEGYVCRSCGVVLEIQKLAYYRPYNDDIIQHARLGLTQIGLTKERLANSKSVQLDKLNKLHSIQSNEKAVLERAKIEISRIFNCLNLPLSMKELIYEKFKKLRGSLKPGTKYRSPEKLIPIAIYFVFKFRNISIDESELLEVSKISKKDFNNFKLQICKFFPQYKERDRKKYILQKVLEITEHFGIDMLFYYQAKKILYKLWNYIKNTKDNVIAGLVASISALCLFKDEISVSSICNKMDIKMSTIQSQVKTRIFEQFKVSGFTTLVKSSDALRELMKKLNILEYNSHNQSEKLKENECAEMMEIRMKNDAGELNKVENVSYHFYALKDQTESTPLLVSLKTHDPISKNNLENDKDKNLVKPNTEKEDDDILFELEMFKYNFKESTQPIKTTDS